MRVLKSLIRKELVSIGYAVYRLWLKDTRLGVLVKQQILRRGLLGPAEIHTSALPTGRHAAHFDMDGTASQTDSEVGVPGFHLSPPLNVALSAGLSVRPHINVLLPSLRVQDMSGGPNTALLMAANLAERGESVRLIATDVPTEGREAEIYPHMDGLFRRPVDRQRIALADGSDRTKPVLIGVDDLFLATAWWTAQMAKYAVRNTRYDRFIYLIQDFEPILHDASTFQVRALETYGFPHIPIINTRLLLDHLIRERCGCYANPQFADDALHFEPAIDRSRYFPVAPRAANREPSRRRVLLFYARPTFARRNLFEIGLAALRRAVASGLLDKDGWEVWAMGEKIDPIPLGNGVVLNPLPWMNFDAYAERVRTADLLLSLMLSPHPSYPPLEMAASGKLVVTNASSVKTAERMRALSPNILVADPSVDSIAAVLESAVGRINAGLPSNDPSGRIDLPATWDESLSGIIPQLMERIEALRRTGPHRSAAIVGGYPAHPRSDYEVFRRRRLQERRANGRYEQEPGLLSFVTCAYDTDPKYLEEMAHSIFVQDGGTRFEWLILDNGSTNEGTRATLQAIAAHPCVRLERVDRNLGIIGGMRYCLERATGRYIIPLDSDDIIEPDCVHVLTRFLREAGMPALLYTDEDKLADGRFVTPYFKPAWDPVLFLHSCYIAHLCAIDREKALALNLYSDRGAEGCHDWDSFIRFMSAGHVPAHVPEVLYSWRIHAQSTSGNIGSKSYITDSHRATLQRFLGQANAPHVELVPSPLFSDNVDWWFRRARRNPVASVSVYIGDAGRSRAVEGANNQEFASLSPAAGAEGLAKILEHSGAGLVHLCWEGTTPDGDEWLWDAMGLMELFPDTVMVGGALHDANKVVDGPRVFGFGGGFDCPERGRRLTDPGYFATMWKPHSVSAVTGAHCVVHAEFLKGALRELIREQVPLAMLGPWLGALAREAGRRVIFSPFMRARAATAPEQGASPADRSRFLSRFWHLLPDEQLLSPRLGLDVASAYAPAIGSQRDLHLQHLQLGAMTYPDWFACEVRRRAGRYPVTDKVASVSILTPVYEGSNIALLDVLADSITNQTVRAAQWVVVVNGPMKADDLQYIRDKAQTLWGATLVVEPQALGIIGAMRRGLEHAQADYIVPVDGDDALTLDAVQILAHEIARLAQPDLIFSDEDLFVDGRPAAPYLRGAFDAVLNLDSSYIWHLLAIRRTTALAVGLYTDSAANWCQDWDSVTRIANAAGRIEHVPEILYHWRQHPGSTTNKPDGDPRSLQSVRHVLEKQIARTTHPERFRVETWPVNRGAKELYIARTAVDRSRFIWLDDWSSDGPADPSSDDAILVVTAPGVKIEDDRVFDEVARLFDLHPGVAAVGGLVVDAHGMVVDGCRLTNQTGGVESPWTGHHRDDAGPYALAAKPQTVAGTGSDLAFFRIRVMKECGLRPPEARSSLRSWILAASNRLTGAGRRIAFSPLVWARAPGIAGGLRPGLELVQHPPDGGAHALARYGRQCPHDFRWARGSAPRFTAPARRSRTSRPGVGGKIGLVYLNRNAEGRAPVRRFLRSLQAFSPGIEHEFITVHKGFTDRELARARKPFSGIEHRHISVDDAMTDIDAYLIAAESFPDIEVFCFLNTFSEIACDNWLLYLHNALLSDNVGIAGATSSYESLLDSIRLISKVGWLCNNYFLRYDRDVHRQYKSIIAKQTPRWLWWNLFPRLISSVKALPSDFRYLGEHDAGFEVYWKMLTSEDGVFAFLEGYPSFPNPSIRTNGFMVRRAHLAPYFGRSRGMTKKESYLFESGRRGLTRCILEQGLRAVTVNSAGDIFDVADWPESQTFRLGQQQRLLIRDNQTRGFDRLGPEEKEVLSTMTWGRRAGDASGRVITFGIPFDAE